LPIFFLFSASGIFLFESRIPASANKSANKVLDSWSQKNFLLLKGEIFGFSSAVQSRIFLPASCVGARGQGGGGQAEGGGG
jgi:hypothetical protein